MAGDGCSSGGIERRRSESVGFEKEGLV
ncbi:hypothetical protein CCACVL1_03464, partial [Corchorus capsularis]